MASPCTAGKKVTDGATDNNGWKKAGSATTQISRQEVRRCR